MPGSHPFPSARVAPNGLGRSSGSWPGARALAFAGWAPDVAAIGVAILAAAWLVGANRPWLFTVDDAYITMHNAQALWRGADPRYGVPALYGATSPVHLLLVAAAQRLLPPVAAQLAVSAVAFGAYLRNIAALARRRGAAWWQVMAVLAAATLGGFSLFHLFNGLEGGLAAAAVSGLILLIERGPSRAAALLCGLLPFIRPELGLLSAVALGRQAWLRRERERTWMKAVALDLALAGCAAAPFLAWNLATFHAVLPNTVSAKRWYFANDYAWPQNLGVVIAMSAVSFGPLLLAPFLAARSSLKYGLLLFAALFYAGYWLTLPSIFAWSHGVYLFVLSPIWLWGLCGLVPRRGLFIAGAALTAIWLAFTLPLQADAFRDARAQIGDGLAAGRWIGANVPRGAVVLVHDDGAVAEGNEARLVDVVGLKTPWAAPFHARLTAPSKGKDRGDAVDQIARRAGARYVVAYHDASGFWYATATDLAARGWTLQPVRRRGAENGYDVFRLERGR